MVTSVTGATTRGDELLLALFSSEEGQADPYPLYRELRQVAPVHRCDLDGVWYLSRYGDCQQLLRDPHCGRKPEGEPGTRSFFVEGSRAFRFTQQVRNNMLWANPPEHTRLRGPASPAFSPRRMEALRDRITGVVDACLDAMVAESAAQGAGTDAMEQLAFRLPVIVIGDLLGVPEEDRLRFRGLADDPLTVDSRPGAQDALRDYLAGLLAQRRRTPTDDVLSLLAASSPGADGLSEVEQVSTAAVLFWAGYATTSNLIGNGLAALLAHPEAHQSLMADPQGLPAAVEEFLRYDSPVQLNGRHVFAPIEMGGHRIEAGESVIAVIGGANRDPERFTDPERIDLARSGSAPLSFGLGVHHCLGAPLARLEAQIVFGRLAARRLAVEAAGEPVRAPGLFVRGYSSLPVRLRAVR